MLSNFASHELNQFHREMHSGTCYLDLRPDVGVVFLLTFACQDETKTYCRSICYYEISEAFLRTAASHFSEIRLLPLQDNRMSQNSCAPFCDCCGGAVNQSSRLLSSCIIQASTQSLRPRLGLSDTWLQIYGREKKNEWLLQKQHFCWSLAAFKLFRTRQCLFFWNCSNGETSFGTSGIIIIIIIISLIKVGNFYIKT